MTHRILIALLTLAFAVVSIPLLFFTMVYRCQLWGLEDAFHHEKESKGPLWREEEGWWRLDFFGRKHASELYGSCPSINFLPTLPDVKSQQPRLASLVSQQVLLDDCQFLPAHLVFPLLTHLTDGATLSGCLSNHSLETAPKTVGEKQGALCEGC